ncbi:MAG: FumA C-terminus/TtdB family hydratase beta subunit [Acholeplasmataceae bacterium]|nr:FumA C-terminus/TtdB family hydratase beta subunit [Acholeplasmataceae bacterium]
MYLTTPITQDDIKKMKAGDLVYITGTLYTARDRAHQKMVDAVNNQDELPFDFEGQIVYYTGPTPAKPNEPIGSCGPTSSYRMDPYALPLMKAGLKVMIGKGDRSDTFIEQMIDQKGVYLQAVGGAGALLQQKVISSEVVAYESLGAEAIRKLEVKEFPAVVTYDIYGGNMVKDEVKKYQKRTI